MKTFCALAVVTAIFGVLRFVVPVAGEVNHADIFKDLAHIWVGVLIGVAACRKTWQHWSLAVGITVLEVVAFFARRS